MRKQILKQIFKNQKGITGLETAIILIAFVVVAAVFAYTALSAGLFATQKSSEAVYAGLKEARSTLELRGGVTATANATGDDGVIKQITFTLALAAAGEGIDFTPPLATSSNGTAGSGSGNKVVISYIDKDQQVENLYWSLTKLGSANANSILEPNENFQITIGDTTPGSGGGNLIDALNASHLLGINKTFTIVVKTPLGAVLEMERTTPAYIDTIMNLH